MFHTSSFFLLYHYPFLSPLRGFVVGGSSTRYSLRSCQQTDARTVCPYKLLITHFARADTRTERPYKQLSNVVWHFGRDYEREFDITTKVAILFEPRHLINQLMQALFFDCISVYIVIFEQSTQYLCCTWWMKFKQRMPNYVAIFSKSLFRTSIHIKDFSILIANGYCKTSIS